MGGDTGFQGLQSRGGLAGAALYPSALDRHVVGADASRCRSLLHELRGDAGRPAGAVLPAFSQAIRLSLGERYGLRQVPPARTICARSLALRIRPAAGRCHPRAERLASRGLGAQLRIGGVGGGGGGGGEGGAGPPPRAPLFGVGKHKKKKKRTGLSL